MAQKIKFKRGNTVYANRAAAITALDGTTFSYGEPVIVQYKNSVSSPSADRFILAIGVADGAGKYKMVGTYDDVNLVAQSVVDVQNSLLSHVGNSQIHINSADREQLNLVGYREELEGTNVLPDKSLAYNINFLGNMVEDIRNMYITAINSPNKTINVTGSGLTRSLDVNLKAEGGGNILVKGADGALEATVDINYNSSNGILSLTRSGNAVKNINLPLESFLESGTYNAATEELWLTVKKQDGTTNVIKIPVAALITEWGVTSTSTVSLSKTRVTNGQDQLSANVKISATAGNAVKANADGLFVADKTADITAANNNANTRVKTIQTANANAITVSRSGDVVTLDIAGIDGGTF